MQWHQNYSALGGNLLLTAVVVAIPIFYLFWALAIQRMKGYLAGVSTLLITIALTIIVYRMPVSASSLAVRLLSEHAADSTNESPRKTIFRPFQSRSPMPRVARFVVS